LQNPPGLPTKATIHAFSIGGLLSLGTWSTQTLATFTISGTMDSFTMISSKGNCSVDGGTFVCGSGVSLTSFSAVRPQQLVGRFNGVIASQVTSGSCLLLASGGSTTWSSDGVPSGTTVFPVFAGSDHAQEYTLSIVST
jgi:ribonuclease T2